MSEEETKIEEVLLVAISVANNDEYSIRYHPFVPNELLIDALETAIKGLKEGKAKTKVDVNVSIGKH